VAYQKAIEQNETFQALLNQLTMLTIEDRYQIGKISRKIRKIIMEVDIPYDVLNTVVHYLSQFRDHHFYVVRSSASHQYLPHASFAGQQDTYLNILGKKPSCSISANVGLPYLRIVPWCTACKTDLTTA